MRSNLPGPDLPPCCRTSTCTSHELSGTVVEHTTMPLACVIVSAALGSRAGSPALLQRAVPKGLALPLCGEQAV